MKCNYGHLNQLGDLYCINRDSEYCTEAVDDDHTCEKWEADETDRKI